MENRKNASETLATKRKFQLKLSSACKLTLKFDENILK